MLSFPGLLNPGFRQPASCLIEVGSSFKSIGDIANLVTEVQVTTSRAEAAVGSIIIEDRRKEDGRWIAADAGLFAPWTPVKISADFQTHIEEIFRGFITTPKPSYPNSAGETRLELPMQDESCALDREHMRKVWGDKGPISDKAILEEMVRPLHISVDTTSGQGQSSRSLSQDATPIVFLRERAAANGYDLMFAGGEVYFGPKRLEGVPQAAIMVYAGKATNCLNLEITEDGQRPDAVQYDQAPQKDGTTPVTDTVKVNVRALGKNPVAQAGANVGTPSVWRISREGDETEQESKVRAQALVNEHSFRIRANGEIDGSLYGNVLQAGRTVTVDGTGERHGGTYFVDKVAHRFSQDGYKQQFELMRNATGEDASALGPLSSAGSAIASAFGF
jgi:hypothetical protein